MKRWIPDLTIINPSIFKSNGYTLKQDQLNYKMNNMVLVLKRGASKEEIEQMNIKLSQMPFRKKLDARKYCGVIKLKEDPLIIQKKLRDEWE